MTDEAMGARPDAADVPVQGQGSVSLADNPGGVSIDRLVAELPPAIAAVGVDARWEAISVASTGATVWRLDRNTGSPVYLKVAPEAAGAADRLRGEGDRLVWLSSLPSGGIMVPAPVASATDPDTGDRYLAMHEIPGVPAARSEARGDAESLIQALAVGLRALHDLPHGSFPFAATAEDLLAQAGQRVRDGLVDRRGFEPIHARYSPEDLYEHLVTMRPAGPEDLVVVHGNPRLDNTLVADGRVSGYVDLGRSGIADRYLDLAIVSRELANRVSPHALGPFFAAYGIEAPDVRKVDFYLLLDEFL